MKKNYQWMLLACGLTCLIVTGCKNKNVWDDSKSAGSFKYRNSQSLWGNDGEDHFAQNDDFIGPNSEDFLALRDEDLKAQFADGAIPQPKNAPGEPGSGIPSVDAFQSPTSALLSVFRTLYFNTDDHILRTQDSLAAVERVAEYLKSHPGTYLMIEGHADERGPEAYNLSLGARRANYVRSLLVKSGVDLNQIHTISYGKERPAELGHGPDSWSKNRRAQFKIYQR